MHADPRSRARRRHDAAHRLTHDIDHWVAGDTRDVTMIDGEVQVLEIDALPREPGDRFAARTGFDPRAEAAPYRWFRVRPRHGAYHATDDRPEPEAVGGRNEGK